MAGSKADGWENEILDHGLGVASSTFDATVWVALYTVAPTDSTAGTEVTNLNAYARTAVTFGAAAAGASSNSAAVNFPTASGGNWGTIVAFAIVDSSAHAGGAIKYWGDLTASQAINDGQQAVFAIGDIDITED